jgi:hypothetical protein
MQHPFGGVVQADQATNASTVKPEESIASRRTLLGVLAGLVAVGTVGLVSASKAQAQATTFAVGEEGGRGATTYAVGEEGGAEPTTLAVNEEGGRRRRPIRVRG